MNVSAVSVWLVLFDREHPINVVSPSSFVLSALLISPFRLVVAVLRSAVACVAVKSSGSPVHAVVRPFIVAVAMFAILAFVTTSLSIVKTVAEEETVISHLSQSVNTAIARFPLPRSVVPFTVFIFVPETSNA